MKLKVGQRLPDSVSGNGHVGTASPENVPFYLVTGIVAETPWSAIYQGKKVFHNFKFTRRGFEEADSDECLDVFLKTIVYPCVDDRELVRARRTHAWFEAKRVLGIRKTNLFPEPLDFVELQNSQDLFAFPRIGQMANKEPVVVFERIAGSNVVNWLRNDRPSLMRIMSVLAEVLHLIEAVHAEQLVLNGLCPAAVWVDDTDRVHYMGSDMVVDRQKADEWRSLFPPERYTHGFSPPEVFDATALIDPRGDLFSWAALAYYMLTDESPAQLAAAQGQRYARFSDANSRRLQDALGGLNQRDVARVAELFSISGPRFQRNWPTSFSQALSHCLDQSIDARPDSVQTLRSWWIKPRPATVRAAIALALGNGEVNVLVDPGTNLAQAQLGMVVRRRAGSAPTAPNDGERVYDGTLCRSLTDKGTGPSSGRRPVYYAVFLVDREGGEASYSPLTEALPFNLAQPSALAAYAERRAAASVGQQGVGEHLPPELALLAEAHAAASVSSALLSSHDPTVRMWAIALLEQASSAQPSLDAQAILWRRGLHDAEFKIRLLAAKLLLRGAANPPAELVAKIACEWAGAEIDERIRVARALSACGVGPTVIQKAVADLESDRIVECKECKLNVRAGDLDEHLQEKHGYMLVDGNLLPRRAAIDRLWSNALLKNDASAAQKLPQLFTRSNPEKDVDALATAFHDAFQKLWLPRHEQSSAAARATQRNELARFLDAHALSRHLARRLVADPNLLLREVARRVLLPLVARRLADDNTSVKSVKEVVVSLTPLEGIDERVAICGSLANAGASALATRHAAADFQLDRPALCPVCHVGLTRRDLDKHKRLQHGLYELNGKICAWHDVVRGLLTSFFGADGSDQAVKRCYEILEERVGQRGVATQLAQQIAITISSMHGAPDGEERIVAAAHATAMLPDASRIAAALVKNSAASTRCFLLAMFASLPDPEPALAVQIAAVLGNREVPHYVQANAVAALLRSNHSDTELSRMALNCFARLAGDKLARLELLESLRPHVGNVAALDDVCRQLEATIQVRCPTCSTVLSRIQMREHLLKQHALVLQGRRTAKAWTVAEEFLESYRIDQDPSLLKQGESLVQCAGGDEGLLWFMQLAMRKGIIVDSYRDALRRVAKKRRQSVCSSCYEFIGKQSLAAPMHVSVHESATLDSEFCSIRRRLRWFWTQVDIAIRQSGFTPVFAPTSVSKRGAWTIAGIVAGIPLLLIGLLDALQIPGAAIGLKAAIAIALAAFLAAAIYRPKLSTGVNVAWELVVPHVWFGNQHAATDSFIAGLAGASYGKPLSGPARVVLDELVRRCLAEKGDGVLRHSLLAPVLRLWLSAQASCAGARALNRSVCAFFDMVAERRFPAYLIDGVFDDAKLISFLDANATSLRWHLFASCQSQHWSPGDIISLKGRSKAVARLLDRSSAINTAEAALALASLELRDELRSMGGLHPADQTNARSLESQTGLVAFTGHGELMVYFNGLYFHDMYLERQPNLNVRELTTFVQTGWTHQRVDGGPDMRYSHNPPIGYNRITGYQLQVNGRALNYASDPRPIMRSIEIWSQFYFQRLRPRALQIQQQRATIDVSRIAEDVVRCKCGKSVTFREGDFAGAVST